MSTGQTIGGRGRGGQRRTTGTKLDLRTAKSKCLEHIEAGLTVESATEKVGRSIKTWEYWRRNDPEFKAQADLIMSLRKTDHASTAGNRILARRMGFAEFRKKYLHAETYWHQLQWVDMIEGREPRDLHHAETYKKGRLGRILINVPPNHAKTTTLTVDYSVYRICVDPNVRIALISEGQDLAKDFLEEIKDKLTLPEYEELIRDFAPEGGFKTTAKQWGAERVRLGDADKAQKDPTIQALGIGSAIYGKRLDLIFMDDCIGTGNAAQWKHQLEWFKRMVVNRPGPGGRIIVVGTRISSFDLYGQFINPDNYGGKESPWSYLAQPAILEPATEDNPEGRTLWPYSAIRWVDNDELDQCEYCDGYCAHPIVVGDQELYARWDMTHLLNGPKADTGDERSWQIVYQQQSIPDDATFPEFAVNASVNNRRRRGMDGGLDRIPESAYFIGSLDPATSGNAFGLVYAIDRVSHMRYVVDAKNLKAPSPETMKNLVKRWSLEYPIKEWRIEKTGLLTMFTQDTDLNRWLNARGIVFRKHFTGSNKWDTDFGVASMSSLFGTYEKLEDGDWKEIQNTRLIELPRIDTSDLQMLVQQLINWTPDLDPNKVPTDGVMALWFAEIAARDQVKNKVDHRQHFVKSQFHTPRQLARRQVYDRSFFSSRQAG